MIRNLRATINELKHPKEPKKIPLLPEKTLEKLAKRIRPVIRASRRLSNPSEFIDDPLGDLLFYIEEKGLDWVVIRKYDYCPKLINPAEDLKFYKTIQIETSAGKYSSIMPNPFSPTRRIVLSQIPEQDLEKIVAFEVWPSKVPIPGVVERVKLDSEKGVYIAPTKLYI